MIRLIRKVLHANLGIRFVTKRQGLLKEKKCANLDLIYNSGFYFYLCTLKF